MSNSLSVAMVTATLGRILGEALATVPEGGVQNARVTTLRPDQLGNADVDAQGINIFLYQVAANAAWRNNALPARRSDGSLAARPEQALDLHYLFTFSGDENALEPQRMLGAALTALAVQPQLSRERLRDVIARAVADDPGTWIRFSDLAEQIDLVRFDALPLSVEDLSRLWAMFVQAPYRLSVTYQASVVLLDADLAVQPALPVRDRGLDAAALSIPAITRVIADSSPTDPGLPGTLLRVEGERLRGTSLTRLLLDGVEVPLTAAQLSGTVIRVALPATVPAGVRSVQVVHPRLIGTPAVERNGAESNAVPLVVRPVVTGPVTAGPRPASGTVEVTVPLSPPVGRSQRVVLLLNEYQPPGDQAGRAYAFAAPSPAPDAPPSPASVVVPVADVAPGTYLVRVQVDGAQSVLAPGPDGRFATPRVVIP
jgi:hypothetical protein